MPENWSELSGNGLNGSEGVRLRNVREDKRGINIVNLFLRQDLARVFDSFCGKKNKEDFILVGQKPISVVM